MKKLQAMLYIRKKRKYISTISKSKQRRFRRVRQGSATSAERKVILQNNGHISKQCNKEATNVLEDISAKAGLIYKSFSAQNISFRAMVDSGSDLSLLREDVFRKFEGLKLTKEIKHLKGIGKGELIIIGSFDLDVFVDNISFTRRCASQR